MLSDNLRFSVFANDLIQHVKVLWEAFTDIIIYLDKVDDELI